ncbi:MAG: hypothetical protein LBU32_16635 [Clostridiales bacterium]|jgi:hypothetical protein|nr:hypothetical protein [Clostridiales bacterium]
MECILDAGCGLDARKEAIAACTKDCEKSKNPLNVEIKAFKAPPGDLQRLKRWIEDHGRRGAAMEGAGAYWRPACGVL